jgi:RNA polymerase sigma-70 factor (ECF subfamily)
VSTAIGVSTEPLKLSTMRPASSGPSGDAGTVRAPDPATGFLAGVGERELVRRAQDGSIQAFGTLVERYEGRVLALLRFRLRPEVEAEDVAQDTFIRAWTRLDQFDSGRELAPWLLTIAARTAVAHNRKARSRKGMIDRAAEVAGAGAQKPEPGRDNEAGERKIWDVARGCLSEDAVTALWLRYGEGMSMRTIGAALGWSEIRTRVAISRSRKRLRATLDDEKAPAGKGAKGRETDHA